MLDIYICIVVLCTSHCVVFYNVPPLMGTSPWEGAFNQLGNKLTIDDL